MRSLVNMNLHSSEHEALFMAIHKRSSVRTPFFRHMLTVKLDRKMDMGALWGHV